MPRHGCLAGLKGSTRPDDRSSFTSLQTIPTAFPFALSHCSTLCRRTIEHDSERILLDLPEATRRPVQVTRSEARCAPQAAWRNPSSASLYSIPLTCTDLTSKPATFTPVTAIGR